MSEDEDMRLPIYAAYVSKTITVEDISDSFSDAIPARSPALPPGVMKEYRSLQRRAHSTSTSRAVPKMLSNSLTQVEQQSQSLSNQVFYKVPHSAQNRYVSKLTRSVHPANQYYVSMLYSPITPTARKHLKFLDDIDDDEILPARPLRGVSMQQCYACASKPELPRCDSEALFSGGIDEQATVNAATQNPLVSSNILARKASGDGTKRSTPLRTSSRENSDSCIVVKQNIVFVEDQEKQARDLTPRQQSEQYQKKVQFPPPATYRKPPKMPLQKPEVYVPQIAHSVRNYTKAEVDDLLMDLDIKKDWNVQFKTLQKLQNITTNYPDILMPNFDAMMGQIHKLLQCLRSTVFKEAIITISVLYAHFTEREMTVLSQYVEMSLFYTLLKAGSASYQDFLAESADLCLKNINNYMKMMILKNTLPKAVVQALQMLNRCIVDKSPGVRSRAAFLASDIFDNMSNQIAYGNDFSKQIFKSVSAIYLQTLPKITQDSNQDCRKGGRRLYFFCKQLCAQCGVGIGLQQFRGVEDVIYKEGVSKMWWDQM